MQVPKNSFALKFTRAIILLLLSLATISLITWAIIRHGEGDNSTTTSQKCEGRVLQDQLPGFQGDPDAYGLGIRLGLYLQWIAFLFTGAFVLEERRAVTIIYVVFNLSIATALLVKVFTQQQCTFTVEIFIILTLFWGGVNIVQVPMMHSHSNTQRLLIGGFIYYTTDDERYQRSAWLRLSSNLLNILISPVTIWYWARLAAVGQQDFASTPGGDTVLFFFARMPQSGLKSFSIFMAVVSSLNFLWFLQDSNSQQEMTETETIKTLVAFPSKVAYVIGAAITSLLLYSVLFPLGLLMGLYKGGRHILSVEYA